MQMTIYVRRGDSISRDDGGDFQCFHFSQSCICYSFSKNLVLESEIKEQWLYIKPIYVWKNINIYIIILIFYVDCLWKDKKLLAKYLKRAREKWKWLMNGQIFFSKIIWRRRNEKDKRFFYQVWQEICSSSLGLEASSLRMGL